MHWDEKTSIYYIETNLKELKAEKVYTGNSIIYNNQDAFDYVQKLPANELSHFICQYQTVIWGIHMHIKKYGYPIKKTWWVQERQKLIWNMDILRDIRILETDIPKRSNEEIIFITDKKKWHRGMILLNPFSFSSLRKIKARYEDAIKNEIDVKSKEWLQMNLNIINESCKNVVKPDKINQGHMTGEEQIDKDILSQSVSDNTIRQRRIHAPEHSTLAWNHGGIYTDNNSKLNLKNLHGITL